MDNIVVMAYDKTDEFIKELFVWLLYRYRVELETSTRGSNFIFDSVNLLHYKCHKIHFKRVGLYINSPDWIKNLKIYIYIISMLELINMENLIR